MYNIYYFTVSYGFIWFHFMVSYPASPDIFQVFCHQLVVFSSFLYRYFHFHQVPSSSITGALLFIFCLFNLVSTGSSFSTSLTSFLNYKIYFFFLIIIIYLHEGFCLQHLYECNEVMNSCIFVCVIYQVL